MLVSKFIFHSTAQITSISVDIFQRWKAVLMLVKFNILAIQDFVIRWHIIFFQWQSIDFYPIGDPPFLHSFLIQSVSKVQLIESNWKFYFTYHCCQPNIIDSGASFTSRQFNIAGVKKKTRVLLIIFLLYSTIMLLDNSFFLYSSSETLGKKKTKLLQLWKSRERERKRERMGERKCVTIERYKVLVKFIWHR